MHYTLFTARCFRAGPCCTPQLQEELSQLSFQTLYSVCEISEATEEFWYLSMEIINMLDKRVSRDYLNCDETLTSWRQNLQEQFAHLISDLQAICLRKVSISDDHQTSLIYEVQHPHVLQVEALDASLFSTVYGGYIDPFHNVFEMLFIKHLRYHRLEFTGQHYTTVAEYLVKVFMPPR